MERALHFVIPRWATVRAAVVLSTYAVFLYAFVVVLLVAPRQALAVQYSRVHTLASRQALALARGAQLASSAGSLIASSPGSVAVRLVTTAAGWPVMGVLAGVTLAALYYNNTQTAAIKAAAATPGLWQVNGGSFPSGTQVVNCPGGGPMCDAYAPFNPQQVMAVPTPADPPGSGVGCNLQAAGPPPANWAGWYSGASNEVCYAYRSAGTDPSGTAVATQGEPQPATGPQVAAYLDGLDSQDPNNVQNNIQPGGSNNPQTTADASSTLPVDSTDTSTAVVPSTSVAPGDSVIAQNVPPPPATQTNDSQTSNTTTQTTSTTDPQTGTTTTTTQDDATISCTSGDHDQRSFGTILQEHISLWTTSGVAAQLNVLQNLTWPETVPVITINDSFFGQLQIDFTAWAAQFAAIRVIVIAGATLAAYRIVFGGG